VGNEPSVVSKSQNFSYRTPSKLRHLLGLNPPVTLVPPALSSKGRWWATVASQLQEERSDLVAPTY